MVWYIVSSAILNSALCKPTQIFKHKILKIRTFSATRFTYFCTHTATEKCGNVRFQICLLFDLKTHDNQKYEL